MPCGGGRFLAGLPGMCSHFQQEPVTRSATRLTLSATRPSAALLAKFFGTAMQTHVRRVHTISHPCHGPCSVMSPPLGNPAGQAITREKVNLKALLLAVVVDFCRSLIPLRL